MVDLCEYFAYGQGITFFLFIMSEILGSSTCKYNGVFQLILGGCACLSGCRYSLRADRHDLTDGIMH